MIRILGILLLILLLVAQTSQDLEISNATYTTRLALTDVIEARRLYSFFNVEFSEDFSFSLNNCTNTQSCCSRSAVMPSSLRCCVSCDPLSREPTNDTANEPGCVCSSSQNIGCVDTSTPLQGGVWSHAYPAIYEAYFRAPVCHNVLVYLDCSLTPESDFDLRVTTSNGEYAASKKWFSTGLEFCCDPLSPNYLTSSISIRISGVRTQFTLRIVEATEDPNFSLDFPSFPSLAPYTVTCDGAPTLDSQVDVNKIFSFPSVGGDYVHDLLLKLVGSYSDLGNHNESITTYNHLTFAILQVDTHSRNQRILFGGDMSTCHISFPTASYHSLGRSFDNPRTTLATPRMNISEANIPCNVTAWDLLITEFTKTLSGFKFNPLFNSRMTETGPLLASDTWYGCFQEVFGFVNMSLKTRNIANTIGCYYKSGTEDYMKDPCCYTSLQFEQCCAPRDVEADMYPTYKPNKKIKQECNTTVCTRQLLEEADAVLDAFFNGFCGDDEANVVLNRIDPPECRDKPKYLSRPCYDGATQCLTGVCDVESNSCRPPDNFTQSVRLHALCLLKTLSPLVVTEIKAQWKIVNFTNEEFYNFFIDEASEGCIMEDQYGYYVRGYSNESYCIEATSLRLEDAICNWNDNITDPIACESPYPWLNDDLLRSNFCATCSFPGFCIDLSWPSGCYSMDITDCSDDGGEQVGNACYLIQATTSEQCLPPSLCPQGTEEYCDGYCYWNMTQTECEKLDLPAPWQFQEQLGLCTATLSSSTCVDAGGKWFRGAGWREVGRYTSEETCIQACSTDPSIPMSECARSGRCSQYCTEPCDQAKCEALGMCNDDELQPFGRCYFPFRVSDQAEVSCPQNFTMSQLGCLAPNNTNNDECTQIGGTWIIPLNKTTCESYTGCIENYDRVTLKPREQCELCGGVSQSIYKWTPAVWQPGVPQNLTWKSRKFAPRNVAWAPSVVNVFSVVSANFPAQASFRASSSAFACRYNRLNQMISQVLCDCVDDEPEEQACYASFQPQPLAATRLCVGLETEYEVSSIKLYVSNNTYFSAGCADVVLGTIPSVLFKRDTSTLYSSLFFASLETNEYAALTNDDDLRIGQLAADGILVNFTSNFTGGNVTVCVLTSIPLQGLYKHADWAYLNFTSRQFTPTNTPNVTYDKGKKQICGQINESGTYFPIMRQNRWASRKYIDTLPPDVVTACFVGAALFMVFFVLDILRLISFVTFTIFRGSVLATTVLPVIIFTMLLFSYTLRWIYFLLVPLGVFQRPPQVINILVAELPIYLNFSVFLLLVLWWMEMLLFVSNTQKSFLHRLKPPSYSINAVMYSLFLAVLIIYAKMPEKKVESCFVTTKQLSDTARIIGYVYKVTVAAIAFTLAAFAFIYGVRLLILITGKTSKTSAATNTTRIIKFTVVLLFVSLGLVLQCIILLYATFAGDINTFAALVLVVIAELGPTGVLILTMSPPTRDTNNFLKNLFWFFFPRETVESTSEARRTPNNKVPRSDQQRLNAPNKVKPYLELPSTSTPSGSVELQELSQQVPQNDNNNDKIPEANSITNLASQPQSQSASSASSSSSSASASSSRSSVSHVSSSQVSRSASNKSNTSFLSSSGSSQASAQSSFAPSQPRSASSASSSSASRSSASQSQSEKAPEDSSWYSGSSSSDNST